MPARGGWFVRVILDIFRPTLLTPEASGSMLSVCRKDRPSGPKETSMGMHMVALSASHADSLAYLLYWNDQGTPWFPSAGSRTLCDVGLTDQQVRYLKGLDEESDGHIDANDVIRIGGTDYPLNPDAALDTDDDD